MTPWCAQNATLASAVGGATLSELCFGAGPKDRQRLHLPAAPGRAIVRPNADVAASTIISTAAMVVAQMGCPDPGLRGREAHRLSVRPRRSASFFAVAGDTPGRPATSNTAMRMDTIETPHPAGNWCHASCVVIAMGRVPRGPRSAHWPRLQGAPGPPHHHHLSPKSQTFLTPSPQLLRPKMGPQIGHGPLHAPVTQRG